MKIAVVFNRETRGVINVFGVPSHEQVGMPLIRDLVGALRRGGYQVRAFEGDKELVRRLEEYMPGVVWGERPGLVFNISYGIQGQARYAHVPAILEMVGMPYVGSGPVAHSLAVDKVVTKMILAQSGLPTPEYALMETVDAPLPFDEFPLIVKPRSEAISYGLEVVRDEVELRRAVDVILETCRPPALVERFVEGMEINVGLLGNDPPVALPPVRLEFGPGGPPIYTHEDKLHVSGRSVGLTCPAPIGRPLTKRVQKLAVTAFTALGCADCARVDMRIDREGRPFILEINSLPALGPGTSFLKAATEAGLPFEALVNRLVDEAALRHFGHSFGTPVGAEAGSPAQATHMYLAGRRDELERRLEHWVDLSSRTGDLIGLAEGLARLGRVLSELGLRQVPGLGHQPFVRTWETKAGMEGGTLLLVHLDVPAEMGMPAVGFRREPEWLYGEGIGVSRAPLVSMEFALRNLRRQRALQRQPLGVTCYCDEGLDCHFSAETLRGAADKVRDVLVLRPGDEGDYVVLQRRGWRSYRLTAEGEPQRPGGPRRRPDVTHWVASCTAKVNRFDLRKELISVSPVGLSTQASPMTTAHRAEATLVMTYLDRRVADRTERAMREMFAAETPTVRWRLDLLADRPPMREHPPDRRLMRELRAVAGDAQVPLHVRSSVQPSVGGLVPARVAVVCGLGPVARGLYTAQESVKRSSLMERTILLAQHLLGRAG